MTGEVGLRVRELIRETCGNNEVTLMKGHISKGHVHLFVKDSPLFLSQPLRLAIADMQGVPTRTPMSLSIG